MAQINKPTDYFNTVLYTGNGGTNAITGVNFQPDWLWIKRRNATNSSHIVDVVRGVSNAIASDLTNAEFSSSVSSFDSDGFTVTGSAAAANLSSSTYAAWNWLAGGTASSNTDGSITSSVSANTTSGFSIVSYTGNGSSGATVGHSLGSTPQVVLIKNRDQPDLWVFAGEMGSLSYGTNYLRLNQTTSLSASVNQVTSASSSTFTLGTGAAVNTNTEDYIAYCFTNVKGFSKFGSYAGNGNADGPFIYTGFKPAFVMLKVATGDTGQWVMYDTARDTDNPMDLELQAESSNAENSLGSNPIDSVSNGFKIRSSTIRINGSGLTFIYMAFAENPLVGTNNIPATAR